MTDHNPEQRILRIPYPLQQPAEGQPDPAAGFANYQQPFAHGQWTDENAPNIPQTMQPPQAGDLAKQFMQVAGPQLAQAGGRLAGRVAAHAASHIPRQASAEATPQSAAPARALGSPNESMRIGRLRSRGNKFLVASALSLAASIGSCGLGISSAGTSGEEMADAAKWGGVSVVSFAAAPVLAGTGIGIRSWARWGNRRRKT